MGRKQFEDDDPMVLVQVNLPEGDPEVMAECFVQEFIWLGYGGQQLLDLFRNPFYAGVHAIYRSRGEAYVLGLIDRTRKRFSAESTGGHDA
ncbi:MAG: hypothetical protein ACM3TN_10865 [Alphaproteobacteria bacterium]